jgi:hypothetical protein
VWSTRSSTSTLHRADSVGGKRSAEPRTADLQRPLALSTVEVGISSERLCWPQAVRKTCLWEVQRPCRGRCNDRCAPDSCVVTFSSMLLKGLERFRCASVGQTRLLAVRSTPTARNKHTKQARTMLCHGPIKPRSKSRGRAILISLLHSIPSQAANIPFTDTRTVRKRTV